MSEQSLAKRMTGHGARAIVLRIAESMREGELTVTLPDGHTRIFGQRGAAAKADIAIVDDEFFRRVLLHGEIGFGEAYMDGLWLSSGIVSLLELGIANRQHARLNATWLSRAGKIGNLRPHRANRNTRERAKHNIHAHYDLGNDFFSLFLDETMTYSCAHFEQPDVSLADAQRAKYRRICEMAQLTASDHVLEIGSGWGGFAIYAAERYGCRVTTITISREQQALASERVARAGLADLVEVRFCDYRDVRGEFDKIVSIEMFEAVGAEYFAGFFSACDRVLRPGGLFVMQTISVPDRSFAAVRDGVNWFQKYIFPGGMLPSIASIEQALHGTLLVIGSVDDIGLHYATTLRMWRERFLSRLDDVRAQGFDERFIRMWEYYLAASEAGFLTRNTGDLQMVFEKPGVRTSTATASSRIRAVDLAHDYAG